jgi:hypothetical protein
MKLPLKVICALLLLLAVGGKSLAKDSITCIEAFDYLMNNNSPKYCFACSNWGIDSKNLHCFSLLIASERYDLVEELVHSKIASTSYFATEIVLLLQRKNILQISDSTMLKIDRLKHSDEIVLFDSGCVQSGNPSKVSLLLARDKHTPYHKFVRRWIKRHF